MSAIFSLLITALAVVLTAYILPSVTIKNYGHAIIVALLIGLVNAVIRPILVFLTFPITIITLGLFLLVINALMIILVSRIVPSFKVNGFIAALLFSIILSVINSILHWIFQSGNFIISDILENELYKNICRMLPGCNSHCCFAGIF